MVAWGQTLGSDQIKKNKPCLHLRGCIFETIIIYLLQKIYLGDFLIKFETGWVGVKNCQRAKSKENVVNTLEVAFLKLASWILFKIFVLMISRSVTWGKKLGFLAKSNEIVVDTPDVIF